MIKKILFICSRNQWRSPTAEALYKNHPQFQVRSAGTSKQARRTVNEYDIAWADLIVVMERHHSKRLRDTFGKGLPHIRSLNIPDRYPFMDPTLIALLNQKLPDLLTTEST